MTRTRVSLSVAAVVAGFTLSACGASGAPTDASAKEFCDAYASMFDDLDVSDLDNMPTEEEMADSIHTWADKMEEVGTPEDISDEAREGFELQIEQAGEIDADDLKSDSEGLEEFSEEDKTRSSAFDDYATETCGAPEVPEVPELPELPEMPELPSPSEG